MATSTAQQPVFDHLSALSDSTRGRLLAVLEGRELMVSELCTILRAPQSTVSRHLKILADGDWVAFRPEGTSRLYRLGLDELEPAARRLWEVVRGEVTATPAAQEDALRLEAVLAERRTKSREFFDSTAGRWDQVRQELFGQRAEIQALLAFLSPGWAVGDLGCGTGQVSESLAPFVERVVAVDGSPAMLEAARSRLGHHAGVEVRHGELEALPLAAGELDAAVLFLVLHHVAEPNRVLDEAFRVLAPGGRLLVVDMNRHEHQEYRHDMGHVWLGFETAEMERWLAAVGFGATHAVALPPDPAAQGPSLFAIVAHKSPADAARGASPAFSD